jgi:hypothetical protein
MGDHADDANDIGMNEVIELYEYEDQGFPKNQDSYDSGLIDELGCENFTDSSFNIPRGRGSFVSVPLKKKSKWKPCKYCGFARLVWKETDEGWRLAHPDGELHACEERMKATAWTDD